MHLEIKKPDARLFEDEVISVQLPGIDGSFGILDNHAPLISALKKGTIRVVDMNKAVQTYDINGGVVEVLNNNVIILAE
jgi:F-type H+-transporting ATPase subunit epsilon